MGTVIRDSSLPAIWGEHSEALFKPVMVKNKLVTTVERAPVDWSARLDDLGFKKGSRAWLRLGPVTQSEFQYISSAIVLKGFRPEDLINAQDEVQENPVPISVQDEIARLWQNNLDAVLFELSFHDVSSKAVAWSHVESAMAGDSTPEADAVTELIFARMRHEARLIGDALDFALLKGWEGVDLQQAVQRGKTILNGGDSIHWADSDGIIHKGRLAMPLRVGDDKAWVYEGGPRFVGGISASTLGQVNRQQVQFLDAGQEWSSSLLSHTEVAKASQDAYQSDAHLNLGSLRAEVGQAVVSFLKACIYFPEDRWRVDFAIRAQEDNLLTDIRNEVEDVLESIESNLLAVSKHYYGSTGVGFCLARNRSLEASSSGIGMRVGNYNQVGFYSVTDGVAAIPVLDDGVIAYGDIASNLDNLVRVRVSEFEIGAKALGAAAGVDSAIPLEFYRGHRVTNALADMEHSQLGGEITANQLMVMIAVAGDKYGVAKEALHGVEKSDGVSLTLFNYSVPTDASGMNYGQLNLSMTRNNVSLVTLKEILSETQNPSPSGVNTVDADLSFAELSMTYESSGVAKLVELTPGLSSACSSRTSIQPHAAYQDAAAAMAQALENLAEHNLVGERFDELSKAKRLLSAFPLITRFNKAIEATKNAQDSKLSEWVKNELMRSFQGRVTEFSEAGMQRLIHGAIRQLRGNQGVVVAISAKKRFYIHSVPGSNDAVSESRDAVLGKAMVQTKEVYKYKAKFAVFDAISFSDPELCSLLAGERAGVEKAADSTAGDYQDTGVVAGYARKDIRGFSRDDLMMHTSRMTPEQKAIYLKREMIWPRTSYEEMKEAGLHLYTAIAIDMLWKSLPKTPKSLAMEHVKAFADLVAAMRDGTTALIEKVKTGELRDTAPHDTRHMNGAVLDIEFRSYTHAICYSESVRGVYQSKDLKVRGIPNLSVRDYSPFTNSAAMREVLDRATWADYLKSKKVARPTTGSRVMRDEVVRVGEDYRNGISVISEDFLKTFGFSGVEYGNWTNQKEREKHLNLSYDSMMDFAKVMGWEPLALSLGGRLGLCIGSRGEGGSRPAAAHLEPANYAINLTRMSGDGLLAHEYFHGVALHFGHIHTGKPQDLLNTFAYVLQKPGALPTINDSKVREPVRQAFRDLQVAIMRKPAPGTAQDKIESYTELSEMMVASKQEGDYWAEPAEMFARAMEIWFADQLKFQGKRNDYLVPAGRGGELYPDKEHLERINQWVLPLLEAIDMEVRQVSHPILGDIEMPVLNSEDRSSYPLSPQDIVDLGVHELHRLFEQSAPKFMLFNEEGGKAGFYHTALDVLGLNEQYTDRETFYHEAWHACEAKLLNAEERLSLQTIFSNEGPVAAYVTENMRGQGIAEVAINAALESPSEMQAYAFQLWSVGKLDLSEQRLSEFYKVRGFVDGVTGVAALLGGEKAESIFSAFMSGELANRKGVESGLTEGKGIKLHLHPPRSALDTPEEPEQRSPQMRMG